jgi:hypothetical protein
VVLFNLRALKMKFTGLGADSEWIPACIGEMRNLSQAEFKSLGVGEMVFVHIKPDNVRHFSGHPVGWFHCTVSKEFQSYRHGVPTSNTRDMNFFHKTLEHARGTTTDVSFHSGVYRKFTIASQFLGYGGNLAKLGQRFG